ncbi:LysE family translocator [Leptolyngbya sp. FACHB-261]|uniref:LysE family translocator n=1 Tax=Leptolyngbya sp. FACHB-261 TaxID=2692806 RepID=UPI001683E223|nr:LysE family translocator [Leptolyngbya sp. FACHB-261]MBD2102756.1 LysE family translocator [Leptolyngbya sp. FACHB-261]
MPHFSNLLLFVAAAIVLIMTPGPDTLYVLARTLGQGKMAGLVSALGICTGLLVHISAAVIGLSSLLMTSALAYNLVKYVGATYLVYLGLCTILNREHRTALRPSQGVSLAKNFSQGVLSSTLNPKLALFFLAFLPQFVDPDQGSVSWQIFTLGVLFVSMAVVWFLLIVLLISSFSDWLPKHSNFAKVQKWLTGSILISLGIRLALPERS